jgi:outer membrane protein OmpA-like peptidoglycan-associated protein
MNHLKLKYLLTRFIFLICFGFLHFAGISQNLVQNGSFEDIKSCHDDRSHAYNIGSIRNFMPSWRSPNGGTPDPYGPPCKSKNGRPPHLYPGPCVPHSGNAVVGLGIIYGGTMNPGEVRRREYIQSKLISQLKPNVEYCISFYIHFGLSSSWKASAIQAVVSKKRSFGASNFEPIITKPTIEASLKSIDSGWQHIKGTFIANGGEKYLTIGSFSPLGTLIMTPNQPVSKKPGKEQISGAYYYIDDVVLLEKKASCPCDIPNSEVTDSGQEDSTLQIIPNNFIVEGLLFELKSAQLLNKEIQQLDSLAKWLIEHPSKTILIVGHTDNQGKEEFNTKLSFDRAISVQQYLMNKGIAQQRMSVLGKGPYEPISDNTTEKGRALNRRVEIIITQE